MCNPRTPALPVVIILGFVAIRLLAVDHAPARDADLRIVLGRAADYVSGFLRDFSAAVAEETYEQAVNVGSGVSGPRSRTLRSDFLLVRPQGGNTWLPFRDVFEVDGKPVRDRDQRLQKLFIEKPAVAMSEGLRIANESSRYNIGANVDRTVNVPTLALRFLERDCQPRFEFRKSGEEVIEDVQTWRIDYNERARPTIIRTTPDKSGRDVPAKGTFWIDPVTGRIVKSLLLTSGTVAAQITVTYHRSNVLDLWVPAEMREIYDFAARRITGTATYSNFRRFQVTVTEKIK